MQDAFIWAHQSSFSTQMLASLRELNHRFIDLAASHAADWPRAPGLNLPDELGPQLAALSSAQRAAAANCPYALFDLRLNDDAHWRACLGAAGAWRVADEARIDGARIDGDTAGLVRLVLFYAWHVASTPRPGAQLWLGMTESTAAVFRGVTLNRLSALVPSEARHLSARWCTSGYYWRALAAAASLEDETRLRRVQLFGLQLAAAALLP